MTSKAKGTWLYGIALVVLTVAPAGRVPLTAQAPTDPAAERRRMEEERFHTDWANLARYRADNTHNRRAGAR